ncbi:uncharacterized protein LOC125851176 [Solanum stenotomum]|uniref:uncharacterized protein LOC125851176 n=1 Tax=Solanum stenotomum TaxID=172797 RepID=UPI0020D1221C|nr:uncharacterized protein LOC125851176 [Solanum stenotomum]
MWKVGRYIKEHTCDMGTCRDGHFNLDVEMIANVLRVDIEKTPKFPIKDCQTTVLKAYGISISRRKAYLGRKRAFEKVYGTWEGSFSELPRFVEALKHFNPGTIIEWKTKRRVDVIEDVFNYVFWTFKPCIDGFVFCRPVISIDGTHVYGKYDIKLLIAIATDGNSSILPLAFAIVANESMETWSLFLDHLHLHVVKGRRGVALILDRHHGILSSVYNSPNWQAPFGFHRFCLRHLKANFQKKFKNVILNNLLWAAANHCQEKKFLEKMEMIKEINPKAYVWLMKNDLDKWTLHMDGGRRWGMLTTNSSESFNGLLKSARGLPVTAMVRLTYNQIVNRFVTRSKFVNQLVQQKQQWMPKPFKIFEDNRKKSQRHTLINYHQQRKNIFEVQTHMHHGSGGNKHIVNASQGKCQCGKWQSYHIPCSHAIKEFDQIGYQAWEHMAPEFSVRSYKKAYSGQFNPLGGEKYWPDSPFLMIANKKYLRKVGVNKITPIRNEMDVPASTLTRKCSTCKQIGHDRRNCPSQARNASYGGSS